VGTFCDGGELALYERALGEEAGQEGGAPEKSGEGTDLTPRRKLKFTVRVQHSWPRNAHLRALLEELFEVIEEVPLDDRVRVYEDDDLSRRGGDAPVVGAGEAEVFFVADQANGRRKFRRLHAVVVHDDGLEVSVVCLV
jgi:hypothetical protein